MAIYWRIFHIFLYIFHKFYVISNRKLTKSLLFGIYFWVYLHVMAYIDIFFCIFPYFFIFMHFLTLFCHFLLYTAIYKNIRPYFYYIRVSVYWVRPIYGHNNICTTYIILVYNNIRQYMKVMYTPMLTNFNPKITNKISKFAEKKLSDNL
jgi:hypothetical protein